MKSPYQWSFSKSQTWNKCQRMYYYSYLKRFDPDEEGKTVDELYHLFNVATYKGTLIHQAIEDYILNQLCGARFNLTNAAKSIIRKIDELNNSGTSVEKINGLELSEEYMANLKNEVSTSLQAFEVSLWPLIMKYQHLSVEKYDRFECGDYLVTLKPDYMVKDNDFVKIFDWKTGTKKNDDYFQAIVYCMYAMDKYDLKENEVSAELVYLSDLKRYIVNPTPERIKGMEARIKKESEEILALDYVPEGTHNEDCIYCKFYNICEKNKKYKTAEEVIV